MEEISRVTRSREQAQASYDRLSRWYDLIEGNWEARPRRMGLKLLAMQPRERLLEIGCGTGKSMLDLPQKVIATGFDLSFNMLALSSKRLARHGRFATLAQGDALRLPFNDQVFDAVFTAFTLELMDTPEIPLMLGEIRRVLKTGGRAGIVSISKRGSNSLMLRLYEWAHRHYPAVVDCRPIRLREAMEEAGFRIEGYQVVSLTGLGVEVALGRVIG